ncbi:SxtJ family membrane protein [Jiulongibacter sp. NS-SX5]|uniref:SxtJ family membrane protein n=1 Tax=Jiulongibacter sp. NS-SX5 TaxID=3463854 RepID=UPI00405A1C23
MEKQNKSQVILSITVGFLVLFAIFKADWLLWVATVVGVLGLLFDSFAGLVTKFWLKLAEVLGRINGSILLTIIFFIFLTPIAFLMRIFKKSDELHLKAPENSNYEERNHTYQAKDLQNIW